MKKLVTGVLFFCLALGARAFAANPSSTNYQLNSYGVGTGGTSNSTSTNYALEGISGEQSGAQQSSTNYKNGPGFIYTQQANEPVAPTFTNPSSYSDKLHFIINTSGNPTDAKYAIAISSDNFATTNYIQDDDTVGATLGAEDYQTYAGWGSGTGEDVLGLSASTTYKIKVKATQGKFTESGYGPTASASTVATGATLSFSITTDSQGSPPFSIDFGTLTVSTVTTSSDKINASIATNATNGATIYIYDTQSGLYSTHANATIASATADLSSASDGYGAISNSATQTTGGPLAAQSPYDGASNNVGIISTQIRPIYNSPAALTGGSASFYLKTKTSPQTPAASDYADIITLIAAGDFT